MSKAPAFLFAFALMGCAPMTPKPIHLSASFDPVLTTKLLEGGNNTIRGSALIRQRGGGVVTCAGHEIRLAPATPYSRERVRIAFGSEDGGYFPAFGAAPVMFANEPPEYKQLSRSTICDAQGYFKFDKLASGDFYVNAVITWRVRGYVDEGGSITQRVSVANGETKDIVLSPH